MCVFKWQPCYLIHKDMEADWNSNGEEECVFLLGDPMLCSLETPGKAMPKAAYTGIWLEISDDKPEWGLFFSTQL